MPETLSVLCVADVRDITRKRFDDSPPQDAGFSAAFVSGYALSAVTLGAPDVGLLTQPEVAAATRNITQAVQGGMNVGAEGMPIIADADTGGGNALNVRRTVLDLIAAGASGCIIEDQMWPKRCGHSKRSHPIISQDEMLSKVRAARDAAEEAGADFFVIARTDARATSSKTGLDLAIERANAYMSAGADASYIEAPRSVEELERIGKETVGPRVANMISGTFTPDLSLQELQDMGYQIVLRPLTGLLAAQKALTNAYGALMSDGSMAQREHVLSTPDELRETLRLTNVYDIEDRYYTEDRLPKTMELNTRVGKSYPYPKAS